MDTDYRQLCIELFGTDNVDELKIISERINNSRNIGRKPKFNETQIKEIEQLLAKGMTMSEVATKYNTSRQIIDKYVNRPPEANYTLRITFMFGPKPCTIIDVDFINEKVAIKNRTDDIMHRAFGVVENPTWQQFQEFLEDRCFPRTRGNIKSLLKDLNIDSYDPLQIVEKTKGRVADDNLWLKFKYFPRRSDSDANN